jgi:hypothetical protein
LQKQRIKTAERKIAKGIENTRKIFYTDASKIMSI